MGQQGIEEWNALREQEAEEQGGGGRGGFGGGGGQAGARTIVRFDLDPDNLLISGGLQNGEALAGAPAVLDAPVGQGHVVMFSINPMWRGETMGSYALVFNAMLHFEHLGAGGR
jgi:hypothetical protein